MKYYTHTYFSITNIFLYSFYPTLHLLLPCCLIIKDISSNIFFPLSNPGREGWVSGTGLLRIYCLSSAGLVSKRSW